MRGGVDVSEKSLKGGGHNKRERGCRCFQKVAKKWVIMKGVYILVRKLLKREKMA